MTIIMVSGHFIKTMCILLLISNRVDSATVYFKARSPDLYPYKMQKFYRPFEIPIKSIHMCLGVCWSEASCYRFAYSEEDYCQLVKRREDTEASQLELVGPYDLYIVQSSTPHSEMCNARLTMSEMAAFYSDKCEYSTFYSRSFILLS